MPVAAHLSASPFPGLRAFEVEESDLFFGREKQTDDLLARLQRHRFLAVVGPSGCGKSSLVRAGMIAALTSGFMADAGSRWRTATMRPGERPIARLAEALLAPTLRGRARGGRGDAQAFLEAALRRGPLGLAEVARESGLCSDANLLLLVDQFEELFRFRSQGNADEADAFVELLLSSAAQRAVPVYVVTTMRADFLGDCAVFHGLPEAINDSHYLTPRLTREQCASAVVGPARVFGGDVDPALVNRLLNDFGPDPDNLPPLQHALMRMWHRRSLIAASEGARVVLTTDDYDAIGGLERALSNHADEALAELSTPGQARIAEVLFRRLTERGAGKRDTRAPRQLAEIAAVAGVSSAEVVQVVDVFRRSDRGFLTPPQDEPLTDGSYVDIGHESLIRLWGTLSRWVG